MYQITGKFFVSFGVLCVCFNGVLYYLVSFEQLYGMFWNVFAFFWDCMWFLSTGIYLTIAGKAILKDNQAQIKKIELGGYLIIFNLVFFVSTFVFNSFVAPAIQSNGRIFTYCLQSIGRLIRPSFSPEFVVPLASIVIFIFTSVLFKKKLMKKY